VFRSLGRGGISEAASLGGQSWGLNAGVLGTARPTRRAASNRPRRRYGEGSATLTYAKGERKKRNLVNDNTKYIAMQLRVISN
jgi:hypothetical protein